MAAPTIQIKHAMTRDKRRPSQSERKPAPIAPMNEPADMDAVMPPWRLESGLWKKSRYWSVSIHMLMELRIVSVFTERNFGQFARAHLLYDRHT